MAPGSDRSSPDDMFESGDGDGREPLLPAHPVGGLQPGHFVGGRYRLIRPIGTGGMGEVWKVARADRDDLLALKILKRRSHDDVQVQRFLREIRAIARMSHPAIVRIVDFGQTGEGQPFYVMEHLRGHTLDKLVEREGPLPWPRAKSLLIQIADALAHAHGHGIIHRDLKPSNVFALASGDGPECRLIDFGVARFGAAAGDYDTITEVGVVHGTPSYMSPEQARGQKVDERTDQYALGILAYQLLTGKAPFRGSDVRDTMYRQVFKHPDSLQDRVPGLPISVEAVVFRLLRKLPDLRFGSMEEARNALAAMDANSEPVPVPAEILPTVGPDGTLREAAPLPPDESPPDASLAAVSPQSVLRILVPALVGGLLLGAAVAWAILAVT